MNTQTKKLVAILTIAMLVMTASASFARNKETNPSTVEVVSVKSTGRVEGVVKDMDGKPIKNAVICIEGCKTGAMTNESGKFYLKNVPCGICTLKVIKTGFEISENELRVKDDERTKLKIVMQTTVS